MHSSVTETHIRLHASQLSPPPHNPCALCSRSLCSGTSSSPAPGRNVGAAGWESGPLATCWPLSHADDPWLHPEGLGPQPLPKGWGGGGAERPCGQPAHRPSSCTSERARTSHRCGRGTGGAGQPPPSVQSRVQQSPPPASADNWCLTAGRRCWTQANLWEGDGIRPRPQITASGEARRRPL